MELRARDYSIDFLKALAVTGVIMIHVSSKGYIYPVGSINWVSSLFWSTISRASFPIFLMCSGALLLSGSEGLTIKKLFTKNLKRIIVALFFWALAYSMYHLINNGNLNIQSFTYAIKEVILFRHEFHLYYLHIMVIVYLCLPITVIITNNATKGQLRYILAFWFVFAVLYPTVKPFWPFTLITGMPNQWMLNMTYASIGYGVLGFYIKKYPLKAKLAYVSLFLAGSLLIFISVWVISVKQKFLFENFFEGMSPFVCMMAAGLFGYCTNYVKSPPGIITHISKASFCIYLVHIFFLYEFIGFGFTVSVFPCIISIPIMVSAIFMCSWVFYIIMSHIPIANKWLV
ncbi:MAG: acyltransferase family protein [Clostridiales bacterium]|jgi:surface polysaccharide O-acyltransferase-like enzyme|nr:acyltransferase family protein [Clostridiales bacterium]